MSGQHDSLLKANMANSRVRKASWKESTVEKATEGAILLESNMEVVGRVFKPLKRIVRATVVV